MLWSEQKKIDYKVQIISPQITNAYYASNDDQ